MRSINEIIQDEQRNSDEQLRAIAEGYAATFMDASSNLSDIGPTIDVFEDRVALYNESKEQIEIHQEHQSRNMGLYALTGSPSNLQLSRTSSSVEVIIGAPTIPLDSAGFTI